MTDEPNPCPLCGALPCDWVDDPHKAVADDTIAALVAEVRRLREALVPFAGINLASYTLPDDFAFHVLSARAALENRND